MKTRQEKLIWQLNYDRRRRANTYIKKMVYFMLPNTPCRIYVRNIEQDFARFQKKGLICRFPDIFNGKKVKRFDPNGRPIGENDIDLISEYYEHKENGFAVAQNTKITSKITSFAKFLAQNQKKIKKKS